MKNNSLLFVCIPFLVLGVIGVFFLALKPTPYVQDVPLVPQALAYFLDTHDFFRNFLGFFTLQVLALMVHLASIFGGKHETTGRWLGTGMAVFLLICFLEAVQILLPDRHSDPRDVLAGGLGVLVAVGLGFLFKHYGSEIIKKRGPATRPAGSK